MIQTKRQISSGGIIFKEIDGKFKVALIARKNKTVWCLPKGKVEKGESTQATAKRELEEETGLRGELIKKVDSIHYWYYSKKENTRFSKTVYFYLFRYRGGRLKDHDWEVDAVRWFFIDEAIRKLTYKSERELMQKAKKILEVSDG